MPLIVLEGLDGAGKSTQLSLLRERAAGMGHATRFLHFPRFDTPVWGELIARFLRGDMGEVDEVDPYVVALLFAGDRAAAAPELFGWLAAGEYVFLDRYVYSNVAYQCAKYSDHGKQAELREWILDLEFVHNALPRPDLSLFLDVPLSFVRRRLVEARTGPDRDYLKGRRDIHEASMELQRRVRGVYLDSARLDPSLRVVGCGGTDGEMLPPEEIFESITKEMGDML